jgi:hypothetical protein
VLGVRLSGSEYEVLRRAASRLRAGGYSRRRFLGTAAALVGGALVGGCGADEAGKRPPSDADVLEGLLRRERALVAATAGGATAIRDQDRRHAARLVRELSLLGRSPAPPLPDDGQGERLAARKQETVFAYVAALPRLADPALRVLVMQLLASEAEHLAALRLDAGEEPVPDAFAGVTEDAAR